MKKAALVLISLIIGLGLGILLPAKQRSRERLMHLGVVSSASGRGIDTLSLSSPFHDSVSIHLVRPGILIEPAGWIASSSREERAYVEAHNHWSEALKRMEAEVGKPRLEGAEWWLGEATGDVIAFWLVAKLTDGHSLVYLEYF